MISLYSAATRMEMTMKTNVGGKGQNSGGFWSKVNNQNEISLHMKAWSPKGKETGSERARARDMVLYILQPHSTPLTRFNITGTHTMLNVNKVTLLTSVQYKVHLIHTMTTFFGKSVKSTTGSTDRHNKDQIEQAILNNPQLEFWPRFVSFV